MIVGNGGREHAIARKVANSELVTHVYVAPGNAGTQLEPNVSNVAINLQDIDKLIAFAKDARVDLTIVSTEVPLEKGIVDAFQAENLKIFGPSQKASQLESSKSFCKEFMSRHNIPTAAYASFSAIETAKAYIRRVGAPIVVKADGLASGKGVVVAKTVDEALEAAEAMLSGQYFGKAGQTIIVEEFLEGEEVSFTALCDGTHTLCLATTQDHKALNDGDQGPNTGGMGAYSPAPIVDNALYKKIVDTVIKPTIKGMREEQMPYCGVLYAGLMIQPDNSIKVLEFNCRFGDPETQVILARLESDLMPLLIAATEGRLSETKAEWSDQFALGVVMASGGYPNDYNQGNPITGLDDVENSTVFHSGTRLENNVVNTAGGRVLTVTAMGDSLEQAYETAYQDVHKIFWSDCFYRSDIGYRAIEREQKKNQ